MSFSYSVSVDGRVRNSIKEEARMMYDHSSERAVVTCECMPTKEYDLVQEVGEDYASYFGRVYELWLVDAYAYMDTEPWIGETIEIMITVETFGKSKRGGKKEYILIEKLSDSKEVTFYVNNHLADIIHVEVYGTSQEDVDDSVAPMIAYLDGWFDPSN